MLFLLALLSSELLFANESRWEARVSAVPASLSGTLDPLTVSYEGKVLIQTKAACSALNVNGVPVSAKKEEHRPFFAQMNENVLEFTSLRCDPNEDTQQVIRLPALRSAEVREGSSGSQELRLTLADAATILLDQQELRIVGDSTRWTLSKESLSAAHVVELRSSDGISRIYDLHFEEAKQKPVIPSTERLELAAGTAPSAGAAGFRLGYGGVMLSRIAGAIFLEYTSASSLNSAGFGAQLGWQFLQRAGERADAPWLELGFLAQAGLDIVPESQLSDGSISGKFGSYGYVRSDILKASAFSLGLISQIPLSGSNPASGWLELNFHF